MEGESDRAFGSPRVRARFDLFVLICTFVVPAMFSRGKLPCSERSWLCPRVRAQGDIAAIESALKEYSIHNGGDFPDRLEALVTPDVSGLTYLDTTRLPKDPWGHGYLYEPPVPGQPQPIVCSYGGDGQPGGGGEDADIDNLSILRETDSPSDRELGR